MQKIGKYYNQISCPVFLEHQGRIEELAQSVNGREIVSEKVDKAQELLDIINILSCCHKSNEANDDCESCRFILHLSKESARLIIDANRVVS